MVQFILSLLFASALPSRSGRFKFFLSKNKSTAYGLCVSRVPSNIRIIEVKPYHQVHFPTHSPFIHTPPNLRSTSCTFAELPSHTVHRAEQRNRTCAAARDSCIYTVRRCPSFISLVGLPRFFSKINVECAISEPFNTELFEFSSLEETLVFQELLFRHGP